MIKPHGSETLNPLYVDDAQERDRLRQEAETLPSLMLSSAAAANAVMLGAGYFNPLTGYMTKADALSIGANLTMTDGLFWPIPILNLTADVSAFEGASRIALRDPNVEGNPVIAVQHVEGIDEFSEQEMATLIEQIFTTNDSDHPGVATYNSLG